MSVFLYVDRASVLHRMHPVTKVLGLVLGFAVSLIFSHPWPALGALALAFIALAATGGLANLRRVWKFLAVLFVMTTLIWSVFLQISGPTGKGGEVDWSVRVPVPQLVIGNTQFGGGTITVLEVSETTLAYGIAMALRIVACVVFGLAFLSCTRTEDFALALRTLGAPQGISIAVSLAFRLVPMLATTARNVIEAQQARGVDPAAGNIFRRLRNYIPLITPVLAYALRGADLTAMALESRGLGRDPTQRTHYREFRAGVADVLLVGGLLLVTGVCIWARGHGYGVIIFGR
ncbi:MAG: energy-coupling factor transporter transmembrane component T family protein [Candidatus Zipacnadales bacterium]